MCVSKKVVKFDVTRNTARYYYLKYRVVVDYYYKRGIGYRTTAGFCVTPATVCYYFAGNDNARGGGGGYVSFSKFAADRTTGKCISFFFFRKKEIVRFLMRGRARAGNVAERNLRKIVYFLVRFYVNSI